MATTNDKSLEFTVKFNAHQTDTQDGTTTVDARAVGSMMLSMPDMLNEFHDKTQQNEQLLIKARPFAKGSFEIPLELIIVGTGAILLSDPDYIIETFKVIIGRIKSYVEVKQKLKGKPLRVQGDNVVIIENSTVTLDSVVFNILNSDDNTTENKFIDTINEIRRDSTIQSLDFLVGKDKKIIASIPSNEFEFFTTRSKIREKLIQEGTQTLIKKVMLTVKKPDVTGASKWGVIYNGKTISVSLVHEEFLDQVKKGVQRFGAGDTLEVDLEITSVLDEKLGVFQEKEYKIIHVYGHNIYKPTDRYALLDLALDGEFDTDDD